MKFGTVGKLFNETKSIWNKFTCIYKTN